MKIQFQEENIVRPIELLVESHAPNQVVPIALDRDMTTVKDMVVVNDASTLVVPIALYHHLITV